MIRLNMTIQNSPVAPRFFARILLFILIFSSTACTNLMFQPTRTLYQLPPQLHIEHQDINFTSADGTPLHGWYLPSKAPPKQTLLFLHGNAYNISTHVSAVYWLVDYGYDVYIFDYRGYGYSGGVLSLSGAISDIEAAISYVAEHKRVDGKFILFGQSLGASMGIYALSQSENKKDVAAYLSLAAFADYHEIAQDVLSRSWLTWLLQWPLSFTVSNDYRPVDYIAKLSPIPVYIMHGQGDKAIELKHADMLYIAAAQPKHLVLLENGHNSIFLSKANRKKILQLLDRISAKH